MRPAALKFKKNTGGMPVFKIIVNQFLSKTCQYQLAVDAVQHNKRSLVDNPRSVAKMKCQNSGEVPAVMPAVTRPYRASVETEGISGRTEHGASSHDADLE